MEGTSPSAFQTGGEDIDGAITLLDFADAISRKSFVYDAFRTLG
jgi:hypothetical protein